jgi:hypothetical protein
MSGDTDKMSEASERPSAVDLQAQLADAQAEVLSEEERRMATIRSQIELMNNSQRIALVWSNPSFYETSLMEDETLKKVPESRQALVLFNMLRKKKTLLDQKMVCFLSYIDGVLPYLDDSEQSLTLSNITAIINEKSWPFDSITERLRASKVNFNNN